MKKNALALSGALFLSGMLSCGVFANEWATVEAQEDGRLSSDEEEALEKTEQTDQDDVKDETEKERKIAVSIPDSEENAWIEEAKYLTQSLEDAGYLVDLRFAWGEAQKQAEDLQRWIDQSVDFIVINPVDANDEGIREQLERTTDLKIPVICLEELLRDTEAEDYLVTYDYLELGREIGIYIAKNEDLEKSEGKTIEFVMGDQKNLSSYLFYLGVMEKLSPYLDGEKLICCSGEEQFEEIALEEENSGAEKERFTKILTEYYPESAPDIICTFSDDYAALAINALEKQGYGKKKELISKSEELFLRKADAGEEAEEEENAWPLITGNGATVSGVNQVIAGKQAVTAYHNTQELAKSCTDLIASVLKKEEVKNLVEQYDNGMRVIPACVTPLKLVDQENYQEILIDSGVYEIEQQVTIPEP